MRQPYLTALLLSALLCGGCVSSPSGKHWWSPKTWLSSKPAAAATAAGDKVDAAQDKAVRSARAEVSKADLALASAPASRPVEVARRTIGNAQVLLDQVAGPLTAEEAAEIRKIVAGLLSDNAQTRAAAEAAQSKAESEISTLSRKLSEAGANLDAAQARLLTAFAKENELADTLRNERALRVWIIGGGSVLLLIAGGAWLYLQIATGGIPKAIGSMLKGLDESDPEKAGLIRSLLDPVTNRIEQALIRKHT